MASVKAKVVTVRSGSRASKVYVRPSGQGGRLARPVKGTSNQQPK
jgi:hypothetical protein